MVGEFGVGGPRRRGAGLLLGLWPSFSYKTTPAHTVLLPPSAHSFLLPPPITIKSPPLLLLLLLLPSPRTTTSAAVKITPEMGSAAYYYSGCEYDYQPHFLDSCSLCGRQLSHNSDIFMYRGNTPFCSHECRQEQIEMDEAMEKKWKLAASSSSKRRQTTDSAKDADTNKAVRSGTTVAVA